MENTISHTVKKRKVLFTFFLFLFCLSPGLLAQNSRTITGSVADESTDEPLVGVTVRLKGETTGTVTGLDGEFSLNVPGTGGILEISYIGYQAVERSIPSSGMLFIKLKESFTDLEEVIVVGYGTQKKINLTGSVETVGGKTIASRPVINASMALQGAVSGVTVTQSSGRPSADGGTIRIRGIGTLNDASPLILVDGRPGGMDGLDPNDIESVSVLKDAASSAIYGSRAANGVILITTKRGSSGKVKVSYKGYWGKQYFTEKPEYVDGYTHMVKNNEAVENSGRTSLYTEEYMEAYLQNNDLYSYEYPNVNWQDLMYSGSGAQQHHHISISGGTENVSTMLFFSYMNQRGIAENFNMERYALRVNNDLKIAPWLRLQADLYARHSPTSIPTMGEKTVFDLQRYNPLMAAYLPDGRYATNSLNYPNLKAMITEGGTNQTDYMSLSGRFVALLNPLKGLNVEVAYLPEYGQGRGKSYNRRVPIYRPDSDEPALYNPSVSNLTESFSRNHTNNFHTLITYEHTIKDHKFGILGGYEQIDYRTNYMNAYRENFSFPNYPVLDAGSVTNMRNNGNGSEWALQSWFGRVNYNYKDRYLLETNMRYDGSSRFKKGNRFGFFPSFSAGWNVTQEKFMENVGILDQLKLRGSWGKLGNQNIGTYPYASVVELGVNYVFNDDPVNGAALTQMANEDITWETTTTTNFGLDFSLWGKFTGSFDIYKRVTNDILLTLPVPATIGLSAPYQNAGKVENKGWELTLGYRDRIDQVTWSVKASLWDVRNKVLDLKETGPYISRYTIIKEGHPINALYMLQSDGLFQNQSEIDNHVPQYGDLAPGDIRYKNQPTVDEDGNPGDPDGLINADDMVVTGSNIPRYSFGIELGAEYKGFDFSIFLQGVGKRDTYLDGSNTFAFYNMGQMQTWHLDYWTPENPGAAYPRLIDGSSHNNFQVSDYWMYNAAYLRIKTLNIGYTLPSAITRKIHIDTVRFYFSANNLFTFHSLPKGLDPEYPMGYEFTYPITASYVFGLNLSF